MKPKHLKAPFSWEGRRPIIHQGVLFVPVYYERYDEWKFPGWEAPEIFGKQGKIFIEYCTGNGAWIVDRALREPEHCWVAVEKQFERVRKIWSKKQNHNLANLFIVCGAAEDLTKHYIPDRSIDGIFINFPDPWPKTKHAKNRLIQSPFVEEMARVIKHEGEMQFVSDDAPYSEQVIDEMEASASWVAKWPSPYWVGDLPEYGTSYFDALWRSKGRQIRYINYVRNSS